MEIKISMIAVLVTVAANFVLGFLWYTPLFGKAWARENGIVMDRKPTSGELAKGMIIMIVGNFFMAYVFAHNMAAWSFVPGMSESPPMASIAQASIFTWLGFYLPIDLSTIAWEKKSVKLLAINTTYHLLTLVIAATILTYM